MTLTADPLRFHDSALLRNDFQKSFAGVRQGHRGFDAGESHHRLTRTLLIYVSPCAFDSINVNAFLAVKLDQV